MSETVIHRHGQDKPPILVHGSVEDVQAALDRARQNKASFASFSTPTGEAVHISPDAVDRLDSAD
jgi:hypothetical protein